MGKVDQPTTRVVSEPERFDQGETVLARAFRGELGTAFLCFLQGTYSQGFP